MYEFYKPVREMSAPAEASRHADKGSWSDPFAPARADAYVAEMILEALKDEATDARYRGKLMQAAASPEDRELIRQILLNGQKHIKMLSDIYVRLTGQKPTAQPEELPVSKNILFDYERCIFASLKAAEFYRKIYFAFQNTETRDMLLEIMMDEQSHGTQFGYLYAKNNGSQK